jgi:hypothetical protein
MISEIILAKFQHQFVIITSPKSNIMNCYSVSQLVKCNIRQKNGIIPWFWLNGNRLFKASFFDSRDTNCPDIGAYINEEPCSVLIAKNGYNGLQLLEIIRLAFHINRLPISLSAAATTKNSEPQLLISKSAGFFASNAISLTKVVSAAPRYKGIIKGESSRLRADLILPLTELTLWEKGLLSQTLSLFLKWTRVR